MPPEDAIEAIEETKSSEARFEALASWASQVQQTEVAATPQKTYGLHKTEETTSKATQSCSLERNPHKPVIPLPSVKDSEHIALYILELQREHEKISIEASALNLDRISENLKALQKLHQENLQALKEYAQVKGQRHTWDVLHSITSYFSIATSFVVAVYAPGTAVASYLLLSAAGLGLTNQLARDYGWWDKLASYFSTHAETKQRMARSIDTFMTALTVGSALFTISWGHSHGMVDMLKKIHEHGALSVANATGQAITAVGTGITTSKVHKTEEKINQNQRSTMQNRFELDEKTKQTFDAMKTRESVDRSVINTIHALEQESKI